MTDCPEIFIGLVAPIGVDYEMGVELLETELHALNLEVVRIKLSDLLRSVSALKINTYTTQDERIKTLMQAGNELRGMLDDGAALAKLAILAIRANRKKMSGKDDSIAKPTAFIFSTLKNPKEIEFLRSVYGEAFVAISFYEPREKRVSSLVGRIATSKSEYDATTCRSQAESLVREDEQDGKTLGQRVSDSFAEADFFVETTHRESARNAIKRIIAILFGHPFLTPTMDEYGMFLAWGVSLRSADLSRQVGAAICDGDGNLIAVGCNDVPRAGGGQYWPGADDGRDFQKGRDSSAVEKRKLISEFVDRLAKAGWLSDEKISMDAESRLAELVGDSESSPLKGAGINNLLEYGRILHAEMAALMDAARRGLSLEGATLFNTTFPCHMCARHIVAAGIRRVVYIEPYPKSRAGDLHDDSLVIDASQLNEDKVTFQSFTGIAPRRYGPMFGMVTRKNKRGEAVPPEPRIDRLRLRPLPGHYLSEEVIAANNLNVALEKYSVKP